MAWRRRSVPGRLGQLEYFVASCGCGSFSAAANQLLVAQPSLSQQMKRSNGNWAPSCSSADHMVSR
ncbi:LysR family transcriptional regulator [Nocardia sp. KC 131]|uniref:helix-turn-helix domain-containing protein n=1 Tax=Nocardia arseniciresistens TaxID=3392119 RepID=UPI00398EE12A